MHVSDLSVHPETKRLANALLTIATAVNDPKMIATAEKFAQETAVETSETGLGAQVTALRQQRPDAVIPHYFKMKAEYEKNVSDKQLREILPKISVIAFRDVRQMHYQNILFLASQRKPEVLKFANLRPLKFESADPAEVHC